MKKIIIFSTICLILVITLFSIFIYFQIKKNKDKNDVAEDMSSTDETEEKFDISFGGNLPSIAEVKTNFFKNKEEYESLRLEAIDLSKKGLILVDDSWTDPSDYKSLGFSDEFINDLRDRMEKIGIKRGYRFVDDDEATFIIKAYGTLVSGADIKIVYSTIDLQNIEKTICGEKILKIEDLRPCSGVEFYDVYENLEGNWYIGYSLDL